MNRQFRHPVNGTKAERHRDKQDRSDGKTLTHSEGFLLVGREEVRKDCSAEAGPGQGSSIGHETSKTSVSTRARNRQERSEQGREEGNTWII